MKKADVKIGQTYTCKVSDKLTLIRIDSTSPHGGWNATNVKTGRRVRIKSAQRLRAHTRQGATEAKKSAKAARATKAAKERATAQQGADRAQDTAKAKPTCYICKREIARKRSAQYCGKDLWRHKGCSPVQPGTASEKKPRRRAGRPSLLDEALAVLKESGRPMNAKAMTEAVLAKGEWSTKGKTPAATLYASILREIQKKGNQARFVKTERGKFALKS